MAETPTSNDVIKYTKKSPFLAKLTVNRPLTKPGSHKDTRHFVIDIEGSRMRYLPGDSLAVVPQNPESLVDALIDRLGFDPNAMAEHPKIARKPFKQALQEDFIINRALKKIMKELPVRLKDPAELARAEDLLNDEPKLDEYLHTRDYADILDDFHSIRWESPDDFLSVLPAMVPRLYSIASCQDVYPNEVHLTIAIVRYETHGRQKLGMASGYLADHAEIGVNNIPVFPTPSKFRLPEDASRDIIMVGPGTGIAPFRAFMQKREDQQATGRNWLFFGEQHRATEFFYVEEWTQYQENGLLTRLDTAFSRDQDHKIYVQNRLAEHGPEIWRWLENGAYFYVCGDAHRMAKDVHQTLIDIAAEQGGMSPEDAETYINHTLMREEKRYLRDVY